MFQLLDWENPSVYIDMKTYSQFSKFIISRMKKEKFSKDDFQFDKVYTDVKLRWN